jgi:hypothetical protein
MNDEAMSVDLGVITKPKMSIGYDKDKGVVVGFSFEADIAPSDLARILDAGKTTSLRAKIFTQAPPMLVTREGRARHSGGQGDGDSHSGGRAGAVSAWGRLKMSNPAPE